VTRVADRAPARSLAAARRPVQSQIAPDGGSAQMFDSIARRYDLLNRLLSFGTDQGWRRATTQALNLRPGLRIVDNEPQAKVVGLDPSAEMLRIARRKAAARGLDSKLQFVTGTAEELPFESGSFDGVCIAFGIRNIGDRARALTEMARVTRPGGRVAVLELSEPTHPLLGALARFHVHTLMPRLGGLLSSAREYR
jgi:demethylmenaquinone methyltransferase/2-methoxy-6-polyprenyl-1,4-benzoquinol methylase